MTLNEVALLVLHLSALATRTGHDAALAVLREAVRRQEPNSRSAHSGQ